MSARACRIGFLAISLAVMLGGCRYYWYKPESTAEQFGKDNEECLRESRSATPATARFSIVNQDVYRACLRVRGYAREKKASAPAGYHRGYEADDE